MKILLLAPHPFYQERGTPIAVNLLLKALSERGDKIDVLFIDGDHTYAGVKADFDLWSPLVRPGGLVIFHDILPHKHVAGCEVDRLWGELKTRFPAIEFVENPEQGWAGIGVIEMIRETESIRPC